MTKEQIRIAIAESLGFSECHEPSYAAHFSGEFIIGKLNDKWTAVPDYPNSRDACAEFEKTLNRAEQDQYAMWLWDHLEIRNWFHHITVSDKQRCEAYLRVKGLWK